MLINDLLADRETVPDATPEAGADAATPDIAAADIGADGGAPEASAGVTVEAPAAPSFDPVELQTRLDASEARYAQLEAVIGQLIQGGDPAVSEQGPQGMLDVSQLDPFADDFPQQLAALQQHNNQQLLAQIHGMFQQFAAPFQQQREQETVAHGESNLEDVLADDIARNGEFHPKPEVDERARKMVRDRANQVYMDIANRYGGHEFVLQSGLGPRVAEQAMTAAAAEVRDLFRTISSTAVEVESNRLATLAGAAGEPGAGAGAVQGPGRFETGKSVVDFYAGRATSLNAA